jgi:hypothetical protein
VRDVLDLSASANLKTPSLPIICSAFNLERNEGTSLLLLILSEVRMC